MKPTPDWKAPIQDSGAAASSEQPSPPLERGAGGVGLALNPGRRSFLKTAAAGAALSAAGGLVEMATQKKEAQAFAYAPHYTDDQLTTVVTSCDHNCGSRHMLVAHKKGDVIVRLSTDDGRYQENGAFGKDTFEEPQLRACLRGRSYRARLYSPERLLYPMLRVGKRGEGKFKRVSWDEALNHIATLYGSST